jgi:hypothetical protein
MLDLHGLTVEKVRNRPDLRAEPIEMILTSLLKHGPASHPLPHTSLLPLFSLAKTSIKYAIAMHLL